MSPSAAAPIISSVTVTGSWITVSFSDSSSGSYTSYVAVLQGPSSTGLSWNFPSVPSSGPLVAQMSLASLSPSFDPTQVYSVTVAGSPGGPTSNPFAVPASSPALGSVTVTAEVVSIAWSDMYPPAGISYYTATLWQGSKGINFPDVTVGLPMNDTLAVPTGGLDPSLPYTVSVTSFTGTGPAKTSTLVPAISATTTCSTLLTDAQSLALAVSVPPTITAWTALSFQLFDGDTLIASQSNVTPGPSMRWSLASPLQAGRQYSVAVAGQIVSTQAGLSTSLGVFGAATPVIVGAAQIVGTPTYNGAVLTIAWTRVADPAVTGYLVTVSGVDSLTFVVGLATTLSAPVALTGADSVSVAAIGASATGPTGTSVAIAMPAVPAVPTAPTIVSVRYDGATVAAAWSAQAGSTTNGYLATLAEVGSGVIGTPVATATTSAQLPATGLVQGKSYQVTVQAIGTMALGPTSLPAAVVVESIAPTSAGYDGNFLTLSWAAAQTPGATYLVEVWEGGSVVASQASTQTTATLAAVLSASGNYTVTVRVLVGVSSGTVGTARALLTGTTFVQQGTTDPMTGLTTFSWAPLTGASSYLFQPYLGGLPSEPPTTVTQTTFTYPVALFRNSDFSLAVAGVSMAGGVQVNGPYGSMYYPPTNQPVIRSASFDGVNAKVSWDFVSGSTGYRVSVLQSGQQQPVGQINVTPTTNSVVIAPTIADPTKTYGVIVQSKSGSDVGPPSAQAPLFSPGFYVSTSPASTYAPFVYPATTLALVSSSTIGKSGATVILYLPALNSGAAISPFTQGPFTLGQNTDPSTNTVFPYMLTIPGTSEAWAFSPAPTTIRTSLQSNYVAFLQKLETGGASPVGIATVQQAISRSLPQTFQETLYYAYGLDLSNHSIDLRPGMVLRVVLGDYVAVSDQTIAPLLNGYVGGPVVDYDVGSYVSGSTWLAGFDAFIAPLVASGAMTVSAPPLSGNSQGGVADGADLFFQGFTTPFYRLFFPTQLQSPTGEGSVVPGSNFAMAAAASYAALLQSSSTPSTGNPVAYFRGRAVVRLCIRVTINGAHVVVPIGTTVGNLLDRFGWCPPSTGVRLDGFVLQRSLGPVTLDPGAAFSVGQFYPVRLDWKALAIYAPWQNALDLPLLHGDELTVTG